MLPFFTVGHSTRTIEEFVHLLRAAEVSLVADIRTIPRSRTNPQYNLDALPENLAAFQIGYTCQRSEACGESQKPRQKMPMVSGKTAAFETMLTTRSRLRLKTV